MPFPPALLERKLEKAHGKAARQTIDNSIDGLRAYLSALNIRNKIKHPLFLVLRFSACVGLLYDTEAVLNPAVDDDAFRKMMCELSRQEDQSAYVTAVAEETGREFVLAVKSSHDSHACERTDCPVQLSSQLALPNASSLPSRYQMLCDHQVKELRRTYCRLYCAHHRVNIRPTGLQLQQTPAPSLKPPDSSPHSSQQQPQQPQQPQLQLLLQSQPPPPPSRCHESQPAQPMEPDKWPQPLEPQLAVVLAESVVPAPVEHDTLALDEQLCGTCGAQERKREERPSELLNAVEQRSASAILSSARQLAAVSSDRLEECPEHEWEHVLRLLSEALAQHCRSRSTSEIIGFMHDAEANATKRMSFGPVGGEPS
uniref:Uncharacterized protein n=1 Tax=Calcidiscus leptoporus TaxID=127549 RepID=A0A7S0J8P1_9EUKA